MYKINILFIIRNLEYGGAQKLLINVVKNINRKKFNVQVMCTFTLGPLTKELDDLKVKVSLLNSDRFYNPITIIKMVSFLIKNNIQVIHSHQYFPDIISRISGFIARTPRVYSTFHNVYPWKTERNLKSLLKVFIDSFTSKYFTTKTIAVSNAVRDFHIRILNLQEDNIIVINNFINYIPKHNGEISDKDISKKKKNIGIDETKSVILNVASLSIQKDHENLILAAESVIIKNPSVIFLIAGDGEMREDLSDIIDQKKLNDHIKLLGNRDDILELLYISDIFILSSKWEGMPVSLIEAMAMSRPVITTDVGGVRDAIQNGENGLIVESSNSSALSNAIQQLINNKTLSQSMGEKGRVIYENQFNSCKIINELEILYTTN